MLSPLREGLSGVMDLRFMGDVGRVSSAVVVNCTSVEPLRSLSMTRLLMDGLDVVGTKPIFCGNVFSPP